MKFGGSAARLWLALGAALQIAAGCDNSPSAPPAPSYLDQAECVEQEPGAGTALLQQGLLADARYFACAWPETDDGVGFSAVSLDETAVTGIPAPVEALFDGLPTLKGRTVLVATDAAGFYAFQVTDDAESLKGDLYWNEELATGDRSVRFAIMAGESSLRTPTIGSTITKTSYVMKVGSGALQVNLRWKPFVDLDLHVFQPDEFEIYWQDKSSPSGGQLDLDSYGQCSVGVGKGNENVFWPDGMAPTGTYRVEVDMYADCGAMLPVSYRLTVIEDRSRVTVYDRQVPPPPEGYDPILITR